MWEEEGVKRTPAPDPCALCLAGTTCPPEKEVHEIDESLIFYKKRELEACVDAALLAAQMDRVDAIPFTYEQLDVLKHKLDEVVHDSGSRQPAASEPSPDPWE